MQVPHARPGTGSRGRDDAGTRVLAEGWANALIASRAKPRRQGIEVAKTDKGRMAGLPASPVTMNDEISEDSAKPKLKFHSSVSVRFRTAGRH